MAADYRIRENRLHADRSRLSNAQLKFATYRLPQKSAQTYQSATKTHQFWMVSCRVLGADFVQTEVATGISILACIQQAYRSDDGKCSWKRGNDRQTLCRPKLWLECSIACQQLQKLSSQTILKTPFSPRGFIQIHSTGKVIIIKITPHTSEISLDLHRWDSYTEFT